ncbi:hypothetical protein JCM6882_007745 [Rhodosporidiobolus microsporus]
MPLETRETKKRNAPKLTNLPVELLEEIFDLAYADKPPRGPICKALLPFHRRRFLSLSISAVPDQMHLESLFPCLTQLSELRLNKCTDVVRILTALPRPGTLLRLTLTDCVLKTKEQTFDEAQQALDDALTEFTSLKFFKLSSDYEAREGHKKFSSLPQSLLALPLEHLVLGKSVLVDASDLLALFDDFPESLRRLTLDFFSGDYGQEGDECRTWRELLESWDLPKWREGFDYDDLEAVLEQAEAHHINVEGSVVDAANVEESFREQKEEFWKLKNDRKDQREWGGFGGRYNHW